MLECMLLLVVYKLKGYMIEYLSFISTFLFSFVEIVAKVAAVTTTLNIMLCLLRL